MNIMPEQHDNLIAPRSKLTRDEIKLALKRVDRRLKLSSTDTEIVGIPNAMVQSLDDLPLTLYHDGDRNALGAVTANELLGHLYQKEELIGERRLRYSRLKEAQNHPEIVGALNIYADEATTEDQDGEILHVIHPNEDVVELLEDMYQRLGIKDKAWQYVRDTCCFGDDFQEVVVSQSLKKILKLIPIPREYIKRIEEFGDLRGFEISDIEIKDANTLQYFSYSVNYNTEKEAQDKRLYPFRILHFRIPSSKYGLYGESVIDSVLSSIEELSLMEKSLLIARVTRAPERRMFLINVGTLQGDSAIKYVKDVMNNFRNKRKLDLFSKDKVDWQKDIFGTVEDIVIPHRAGEEGHKIDTLAQLNNPGDIGDLEFIRDKIFPGLGIPRQYLYDDQFTSANTNLSSKSKPFAKKVRRIQRCFLYQMYKLAYIELKLNGYSERDFDELVLLMNNPSNIDEKENLEIETNRWNLIAAMKQNNAERVFIPDYVIYRDVLKLSDEEIVEWMKLSELQAARKNVFEAMPEDERPEGAEDLTGGAEATAEATPGGGAPGGAAPAEGAPEGAPPEGGEAGAEAGEVPPEAMAALGPPPKAEVAEYIPVFKGNEKYLEANKRKESFLKFISESMNDQIIEMEEVRKEKQTARRKKTTVSYEEMNLAGEFEGIEVIIPKKVYTEDEE